MAEIQGPQSGVIAEATPESAPSESLQQRSTEQPPPNGAQPAGSISSSKGDEKKAMFVAADAKISEGSQKAGGVTLITPAKTDHERAVNAANVYRALASKPETKAEAETFLKELAAVGKKLGYNFGFKEIIEINNSQPAAQSTGSNAATPQTPSKDGNTQATGGDAGKPTAQSDLKAALTKVAALDGDRTTISRDDIALVPKEFQAALTPIVEKLGRDGTMSVDQAIKTLNKPGAGKPDPSAT